MSLKKGAAHGARGALRAVETPLQRQQTKNAKTDVSVWATGPWREQWQLRARTPHLQLCAARKAATSVESGSTTNTWRKAGAQVRRDGTTRVCQLDQRGGLALAVPMTKVTTWSSVGS